MQSYFVVPCVVFWELLKRKNIIKHGGTMSVNRVIYQVTQPIHLLLKTRRPSFQNILSRWLEMRTALESYTPRLKITKVLRKFPPLKWYKCNTDGASSGNIGRGSFEICLRNYAGDLLYAQTKGLEMWQIQWLRHWQSLKT